MGDVKGEGQGYPDPEDPVVANLTASGLTELIPAPGAGLSLYIQKGSVHNAGSSQITVQLQDGAGSPAIIGWAADLAADGGGSLFDFGDRGWKLTANLPLNGNLSATGNVDFNITQYFIAP